MAPYIEAKSLSDITQIASNPPKYPRNPTEPKRQSLTLYLARVPGSRDIILTTLKPQLKNVTAADVASSLYYCHLNTEDDARFLEGDQRVAEEETTKSTQELLLRKSLPESARSSLDMNRQMNSVSLTPGPHSWVPRRKPVINEAAVPVSSQSPGRGNHGIPRRPLGPRPIATQPTLKSESLPGTENRPWISDSQLRDGISAPKASGEAAQRPSSSETVNNQTEVDLKHDDAFSITLIRRDPSSGSQWNVGTISGHPGSRDQDRRGAKTISKAKKSYFDISVQLSTPGYSAFRIPFPTGHEASGTADVARRSMDISIDQAQTPSTSHATFDRQVRMQGMSNFWSRPSRQHQRTRSDLSDKPASSRGKSSSGSSDHGSANPFIRAPGFEPDFNDSRSKGYMFVSPWGGRCKFSTGGGGRSLLCKHILPATVSASSTGEPISSSQISAPVSELRFNLPSSALFSSSNKDTASKRSSFTFDRVTPSKFGNFQKKLSPQKDQLLSSHRPDPTSYAAMYPSDGEDTPQPRSYRMPATRDGEAPPPLLTRSRPIPYPETHPLDQDDEEDYRLDLSIGQEKAGGGNRGKRAKLGKLIIHNEGLKMLDLVVAANIGIWWSVWEFNT